MFRTGLHSGSHVWKVPPFVTLLVVSWPWQAANSRGGRPALTLQFSTIIFTFHPAESLQRRLWPPSYASFVCVRVNRLFNSAKPRRGSALNAAGQSSLLAGASVKWKDAESKLSPCILLKLTLSLCLISRLMPILPWAKSSLWTRPRPMWQQTHTNPT